MAVKKIKKKSARRLADSHDTTGSSSEIVQPENSLDISFPVVGIGASAGGLAAFEEFFSGMLGDADPGMAFVLVQHLAPNHKSTLAKLIRHFTRMRVFEVEDGMPVQINCVYIIPANYEMALVNGTLKLLVLPAQREQRLPIDFLFRSLAQDQHERAIGIVLSGTGNDGTTGVRAIKGEGGLVMVQSLASAEFDGMPRSAIATGVVDYELSPGEMASRLIAYSARAFGKDHATANLPMHKTESAMKKIFALLRAHTGHDFSQYKPSTLQRRIERRMAVHQIEMLDDYVGFLQHAPDEIEEMFRELLIGVTNFFRDPEVFQVLEEEAIPRLYRGKPANSVIRVWSVGCSTGEEAYSIAILLHEHMEKLDQNYLVQVFATDIDSRAIATARAGVYPASIAADISPQRLARYFTTEPGGEKYRIKKCIREMLIFSEQNIIKDPPFSKIDMLTCRNLLIYFGTEIQKRLMPLFRFALNPNGILFLGTSEGVGEFSELFSTLDRNAKLYQRKIDFIETQHTILKAALPRETRLSETPLLQIPPRDLTEQSHLRHIAPAGALQNEANGSIDARIEALNSQLRAKDEYIQSVREEMESANEELKSSNEELQSVNAELQSANEELEATKEEMQSANQELALLNAELSSKLIDLAHANNDMNNLLAGTGIATVFVNHQQHILRFTPSASQITNMILSDVGRPVAHIATNLVSYNKLSADTQAVLDTLIPKELEVQSKEGKWYMLRIQPYRTLGNVIEGAAISFVEITEMVSAREALHKASELAHWGVVVHDALDAIAVHDLNGKMLAWNLSAEKMYGWSEAEALAMSAADRIPADLRDEELAKIYQLTQADILQAHPTRRLTKNGVAVEVWLTATALLNLRGQMYAIATTERIRGASRLFLSGVP